MDRDEKFEHLFDDDDEFKTEPGDFHFDEDIKFDEPAEYQFSDDVEPDDVVLSATPIDEPQPGLFEKLSQVNFKKIVIYLGVGILALGFIGASLKALLNRVEEPPPAAIQTSNQPQDNSALLSIETETKKPKGQLEVDVDLAKQLKMLAQQNTSLAGRVQVLETQLSQTASQLATYQSQAAQAQANADGLTKTISSVEEQMTQINNALQTLVSASKPSASSNVRSMDTSPTIARASSYYVQAIIPGRAWLKANNGQIITVALGDGIPGFGNVTIIDPQNGFVRTDAGITINYAIDQG